MQLIKKLQQGLKILKLTGYKYFRAAQLQDKEITYFINHKPVIIKGSSVLSMMLEIVAGDIYHLKDQHDPKVIFDVGANVGIFSLHAAALFPGCSIYAFEPSVENFDLLKTNTKDFKNINCFNMAVSNYDGIAYLTGDSDNTAFKISAAPAGDVLHTCETITLNTFLSAHAIQNIDVLKLDCEGAEYDIVEEDLNCVRQVVGEYHYSPVHTLVSLKNTFLKKGFSIKQWTGDTSSIFWVVKT